MAEEENVSYPIIPVKQWWKLRKSFENKIPSVVTLSYLATLLGMQENSARTNILRPLAIMGIIDAEGKPTDLARRWRDNDEYLAMCHEIRDAIYPDELRAIAPGPSIDRSTVESWFLRKTGVGKNTAKKMAAVYELLTEADSSKEDDGPKAVIVPKTSKPTPPKMFKSTAKPIAATPVEKAPISIPPGSELSPTEIQPLGPSLHFDIQIHISAETSAEQIDQIFSSMAKHLADLLK